MKRSFFLALCVYLTLCGMESVHDDEVGQLAARMDKLGVTPYENVPEPPTGLPTEDLLDRALSRNEKHSTSEHFYCNVDDTRYPVTHLCDQQTGCCLLVVNGSHPVLSPNERFLAVRSVDNLVLLWDLLSGNCLGAYGQGECCRFSPDNLLLCHCHAGIYHVWDIASRTCIFEHAASMQRGFAHFVTGNILSISDELEGLAGLVRHEECFDIQTHTRLIAKRTALGLSHQIVCAHFAAIAANGCVKVVDHAGKVILERCGTAINAYGFCLEITQSNNIDECTDHEIWHMLNGQLLCAYHGFAPQFFEHDQYFLIERDTGALVLFDSNGTVLFEGIGYGACSSIDGTKIITFVDDIITIFDRASDRIIAQTCFIQRAKGT